MTHARTRCGLAAAAVLAAGVTGSAYLQFGVAADGGDVPLHWSGAVRYFVTDRPGLGMSASDAQAAIARAFRTWQGVGDVNLAAEFVGFTGAAPFEPDGVSVIGFEHRPEFERTLRATTYTFDERTGEIIEADIFFNTAFAWSTAAAGQPGAFDLQSIALHEIGHLFGLGHSALGETERTGSGGRRVVALGAVMFPIAFSAGSLDGRTLHPDDIAGISDVYGSDAFRRATGSISGTVTRNGRGVFGAHLVALNLRSGSLVGGFSLREDGGFTIAGLEPGPSVLRAEPLDDADVGSFLDAEGVDVDFRPTFAPQVVVVPAGGAAARVTIAVATR